MRDDDVPSKARSTFGKRVGQTFQHSFPISLPAKVLQSEVDVGFCERDKPYEAPLPAGSTLDVKEPGLHRQVGNSSGQLLGAMKRLQMGTRLGKSENLVFGEDIPILGELGVMDCL